MNVAQCEKVLILRRYVLVFIIMHVLTFVLPKRHDKICIQCTIDYELCCLILSTICFLHKLLAVYGTL